MNSEIKDDVVATSWKEFFEYFSYKPNWEFIYTGDRYVGAHSVLMKMHVPDSRRPIPGPEPFWTTGRRQVVPLIPITKTIMLDRWVSEDYAKDYIRWHILDMEIHEVDEWFKYKGELSFDPHKENG